MGLAARTCTWSFWWGEGTHEPRCNVWARATFCMAASHGLAAREYARPTERATCKVLITIKPAIL